MGFLMPHDLYDLTQHPPRSPRVRLGGLVILPRMIDKARATKAGKMANIRTPAPAIVMFWTSSASMQMHLRHRLTRA